MPRCVVKSAIKMESSKIRLRLVFPVTLTRTSTLAHWAQIALHATILQIGIRQVSICHTLNLEPKREEVASITAELPAASVIHPLCNSLVVHPAMKVALRAAEEMIK